MKSSSPRILLHSLWLALTFLVLPAVATDRFFSDMEAASDSGRYVIKATSPDNEEGAERRAFQGSFTYTCTDTMSGKTLWTRKQPMGEEKPIGEDPKNTYTPQEEGSPATVHVSDSGYSVIYTGWQELIVIDLKGKVIGKLEVFDGGLTKEEQDQYVSQTTAGPMWAGRSHWYFVKSGTREYFVIRPWWGRHLVIDLATGKWVPTTEEMKKDMTQAEQSYVIRTLQHVSDGSFTKCECCGGPHEASFAAYLAAALKTKEVIPALRKLEDHPSIGSSTMGGFDEVPEGRINPFNYSTYTTRQSIHLALRRLGEEPGRYPCTRFKTEHEDYDQMKPYVRQPVEGSRDANEGKVQKGMSPEQVIDLLDCPDYIPSRVWQYDIDAEDPYTLAVSWTDERTVESVKIIRPALWQQGSMRDRGW